MTRRLVPGLALVLLAGCGGSGTHTLSTTVAAPRPCAGKALGGTFALVPGSPGAGNVVYRLRLTNRSGSACFVSGLPAARLLSAAGKPLPTHVSTASRGQGTAVLVLLRPGQAAAADARFSPDVPGPTEQHPGRCEPVAARLRVSAPGGGAVTVPVKPPTSVCERGTLSFRLFARAG